MRNPKRWKSQKTWPKKRLLAIGVILLTPFLIYVVYSTFSHKEQPKPAPKVVQEEKKTVVETAKKEIDQSQKIVFGTSVEGKPINGYVFGTGSDTTLMFGAIHGNEMGTADLLDMLSDYLKSNPESISKDKRVVIIPILNPDGYYDRVDKVNADDVNLNLNFQTSDWAMYGKEGQYAGPEPWSEPESRVIKAVVEKYLPNRMISYHSNGSLVNPEFLESSQELAWWYAVESGYYYFADPSWDYSGTATKWFEETYKKPAITIELNDHLLGDWGMNKKPMLELLK
jgi:hypothetical protein